VTEVHYGFMLLAMIACPKRGMKIDSKLFWGHLAAICTSQLLFMRRSLHREWGKHKSKATLGR